MMPTINTMMPATSHISDNTSALIPDSMLSSPHSLRSSYCGHPLSVRARYRGLIKGAVSSMMMPLIINRPALLGGVFIFFFIFIMYLIIAT